MRQPLVAGNWKMNGSTASAAELLAGIKAGAGAIHRTEILVCPPFPYLAMAGVALAGTGVAVGAQNACTEAAGAYTVIYAPGQCTIVGAPGGPMYAYPGGPQTSVFVAGGPVEAKQRTVYNSMDWYMIQPEASMGNPPMWVPVTSLASVGSGCS